MKYDTVNNKKKVTIHGWWFVLGAALWLQLVDKPHAGRCSHAALDQFLADVQERGGSLVRCIDGECRDVRTGASYGRKQDGLYILYPEGTVSETELAEQSRQVQRLMLDEEQACGAN